MKYENKAVFAIVIAFAVISFWRGVWGLMDLYLFPDDRAVSFTASILIGLLVLSATHYVRKELI